MNSLRLRIFTEPQQGASYDHLLAAACRSEELGFDGFFRSDHYLKMGSMSGLPGPTDSWVTLGALARETTTIRLGTLVTSATFRFPGPLAIAVAQVDAMSGGRVELGLGAGWYDAEHAAYAIPFPEMGERFERLAEQLEIVTGLWNTPVGETFSFTGAHYAVTDSPALPKPVQRPGPPVIIGGLGRVRTPRLAARFASEFNHMFPAAAADTVEMTARIDAACREIGRDPSTLGRSFAQTACVGATDADYVRRARALEQDPDRLRASGIAGTVDEAREKLASFADAGIDTGYLQVLDLDDLDHLEVLARLL